MVEWSSEPPAPRIRRPVQRRTTLERNASCREKYNACAENARELRDAIGHDPEGHRIAKRLVAAGITTRQQILTMSLEDLLVIRGISEGAIKHLQDRGVLGTVHHAGPAPTGASELNRMVQYLLDCWSEERTEAALDDGTGTQDSRGVLADLDSKEQLLRFLRPMKEYGHAVRILLQRYAQNDDFPDSWRLSNPAAPGSITQGEAQQSPGGGV
ncbi:hypothetical protein ACWGQ5_14845 [Streptomyces sp. NPDC055722]